MATILLIDKDYTLRETLEDTVFGDSHALEQASSFEDSLRLINRSQPDLVIVGTLTTTGDRVDMCQRLRSVSSLGSTPILFLVNALSPQDVATMLDAGGDDCMAKPFVARELDARVRALLRRHRRVANPRTYLTLYRGEMRAELNGRPLMLTPIEFELLDTLCQHPGEHLSAAQLLERVWNYPAGAGDPALVRNHVRNLRRKLELDPDRPRIVTSMHGRGYAINVEVLRR